MNTKKLSTLLLTTTAMLGIGIGSAFAQGSASDSGYVYPDFWAETSSQPAHVIHTASQAHTTGTGAYDADTDSGIELFPPNPNQ